MKKVGEVYEYKTVVFALIKKSKGVEARVFLESLDRDVESESKALKEMRLMIDISEGVRNNFKKVNPEGAAKMHLASVMYRIFEQAKKLRAKGVI